jgi:hypothetical protein
LQPKAPKASQLGKTKWLWGRGSGSLNSRVASPRNTAKDVANKSNASKRVLKARNFLRPLSLQFRLQLSLLLTAKARQKIDILKSGILLQSTKTNGLLTHTANCLAQLRVLHGNVAK